VASIPSSDIEIGGDAGRDALTRLKNVFGRVQSPWRPATAEESFEIVRRRLFQPMEADGYRARDAVILKFMDMYNTQKGEFPAGVSEGDYRRRMESSYPLHPELFDRLYEDWSSLERFQRTRGVLRLMAAVVHALWLGGDKNPLIMPANVTLNDAATVTELMLYVDDALRPIIDREVDGPHSLPLEIDKNPNFGRYSAARRVARTIYFGSAPKLRTAQKGIESKRIILGSVQPGETVATFRDALSRLTDKASHLYVNENRYWFDTQPSINRIAQDRADSVKDDEVWVEIVKRLRNDAKARGEFDRVQVIESAAESTDVPDERDVRLVVIGPEAPHSKGASSASTVAQTVLEQRGNSPRTYKNSLIFAVPDAKGLESLKQAVRAYLAWKSIHDERETLNLDPFQSKQVDTKLKQNEETMLLRVPETYQTLLVPEQQDPKGGIEWREVKITGSRDPIAHRASKKLINDGMLIAGKFGGELVRRELDRIPLWRGDHVSTKQLADDFATYIYLPRLKNPEILVGAIRDGATMILWGKDGFAYAGYYNEGEKRYMGLAAGPASKPEVQILADSYVIKPEVAMRQIEGEKTAVPPPPSTGGDATRPTGGTVTAPKQPSEPVRPRRFYVTVEIDPLRLSKDAAAISEAIVQHLSSLVKSEVTLTLDIVAKVPAGIHDNVERTVSENCRTLGIRSFSFEQE
jgi:hypothetical protein